MIPRQVLSSVLNFSLYNCTNTQKEGFKVDETISQFYLSIYLNWPLWKSSTQILSFFSPFPSYTTFCSPLSLPNTLYSMYCFPNSYSPLLPRSLSSVPVECLWALYRFLNDLNPITVFCVPDNWSLHDDICLRHFFTVNNLYRSRNNAITHRCHYSWCVNNFCTYNTQLFGLITHLVKTLTSLVIPSHHYNHHTSRSLTRPWLYKLFSLLLILLSSTNGKPLYHTVITLLTQSCINLKVPPISSIANLFWYS